MRQRGREGRGIDPGIKLLQRVGGQWFGHTAMDLCGRLCRPSQRQA